MDAARSAGYNHDMDRNRTGWITAFLVAVLMTASPLFLPAVLCVGADGHVALESSGGGPVVDCRNCHEELREKVKFDETGQMTAVDGCGACSDFAVYCEGCPHSLDDSAGAGRLFPMPNAVATALANGRLQTDSFSLRPTATSVVPSTLFAHSTVVLLC